MSRFNKHIIILGSARSGTSWLSETMASQHRYRLLFEPEHETQTQKGHLVCDKWYRNTNDSPDAHRYLNNVFGNKIDNDWIAQNSNRKFKRHLWPLIPKKYIIKFVRANLLSHYFNDYFEIPVIHMIRNPYDVILSQKRVKFPWLYDLSHFVVQEDLKILIKDKFNFDISNYSQLSDVEVLTLRWCIENVLPLEVLKNTNKLFKLVRYEDLKSNVEEYRLLCEELDITPIDDLDKLYAQPSTKTHSRSVIINTDKQENKWVVSDLERINLILDVFKTRLYPKLE
ncbi:sulfotransferase domain-containing protein [Hanstruepera ponticola]|uniref:sulfotransferase domain-containing protein n=1 Tax=Hanstruepera ponticola TaxID=2042995 RepID=UPI000CF16AFA|nr:sulfotransferase domain-containing protein [Hanstruepera ponticola]